MASFMLLLHTPTSRRRTPGATAEDFARITREYADWADGMRAKGLYKAGNKLTDDAGKVMRTNSGRVSTTDGPFAESKEMVGGFFIITAGDYLEACRIAESCPHLKYGSYIEVRQIQEM